MRVYLDASVLVALLTNDPLTARADAFLHEVTDSARQHFGLAAARKFFAR